MAAPRTARAGPLVPPAVARRDRVLAVASVVAGSLALVALVPQALLLEAFWTRGDPLLLRPPEDVLHSVAQLLPSFFLSLCATTVSLVAVVRRPAPGPVVALVASCAACVGSVVAVLVAGAMVALALAVGALGDAVVRADS